MKWPCSGAVAPWAVLEPEGAAAAAAARERARVGRLTISAWMFSGMSTSTVLGEGLSRNTKQEQAAAAAASGQGNLRYALQVCAQGLGNCYCTAHTLATLSVQLLTRSVHALNSQLAGSNDGFVCLQTARQKRAAGQSEVCREGLGEGRLAPV